MSASWHSMQYFSRNPSKSPLATAPKTGIAANKLKRGIVQFARSLIMIRTAREPHRLWLFDNWTERMSAEFKRGMGKCLRSRVAAGRTDYSLSPLLHRFDY